MRTRWIALVVVVAVAVIGAAPSDRRDAVAGDAAAERSTHGGFTDDLDCSACHTADGWGLAVGAGQSGFDHDRTGFPLRGAHVQSECAGCHKGKGTPATTCDGCHRDSHQGKVEGECVECHTATGWDDTETLARHRQSRMPLTGRHALLDCEGCHQRQDEGTWSELPTDCYACHATDYRSDIHPDHDGDPADPAQEPFSRECGRCHRTSGWTPAVIDPETIARRIDPAAGHDEVFVLTSGAHADAACDACHVDARKNRRVRCDGCHTRRSVRAQHAGKRPGRDAASCLRCHPRGAAR
jgi:hypothetical protein